MWGLKMGFLILDVYLIVILTNNIFYTTRLEHYSNSFFAGYRVIE